MNQSNFHVLNSVFTGKKSYWESFLQRSEACRLDLTRHEKTREKYLAFLNKVGREEQGKQFFHAIMDLLQNKGVVNIFRHASLNTEKELDQTFCGHLCKLFDKKLDSWFDTFEAVSVRLTAHVKVSNFVRVLTGQIDLLCRKNGRLCAINVKVTGMTSPRPMDVNEMCLVKAMIIQNGLAAPSDVVCGLLVCHLSEERPVLRLWEYKPTAQMDRAILEADIDNMIDAGRLSQYNELWKGNLSLPSSGGGGNGGGDCGDLTARDSLKGSLNFHGVNMNGMAGFHK